MPHQELYNKIFTGEQGNDNPKELLQDICNEYGIARKAIDDEAVRALQEYNWTGNIRELRNVVERLIILSSKSISREDVANYVLPKK